MQASGGWSGGTIVLEHLAKCEYLLSLNFSDSRDARIEKYTKYVTSVSLILCLNLVYLFLTTDNQISSNGRTSEHAILHVLKTLLCSEKCEAEFMSLHPSLLLYLCYQQLPAQGLGVEEVPTYPDYDTS